VSALAAPAASPAGALARLRATLDEPGADLPVTVEHLVRGAWVRLATIRVAAVTTAEVPVRLLQPGVERLRARVGGPNGQTRASGAVTVRVTRPGRRRLSVGTGPSAVAAGAGALWVLGDDGDTGTVRRLDPATGRPLGRLVIVGDSPTAIAAGAGAVWVVRAGGELVRIDPVSGDVGPARQLPASGLSVTAGPGGVWVGGVCLPEPTPATACSRQVALGIDPATGAPDGRRALLPGGQARSVRLVGSTLWLWGPRQHGAGTVLARADAATGAVRRARSLAAGAAIVPVSAGAAWSVEGGRVASAWPAPGRTLYRSGSGSPSLVLAPAAASTWALERARRGGTVAERLLALDPRSGRVRGRSLALGEAAVQADRLAVGPGVVWLLRPREGALIRIAVAGRG
jgi:hypothetical protein